jgi:addiction module HigA family antidote
MVEFSAMRDPDRCPSHPGAVIADMVAATGMTKAAIAHSLGISRQQLYDILREAKPLSARIAARIGKGFGGSTGSWLRMQAAYDAWHAEREMADEMDRIPALGWPEPMARHSRDIGRSATSGRFSAAKKPPAKKPLSGRRRTG